MTRPKVLVGCPIFERAWVFADWMNALVAEHEAGDIDLAVALCLTKGKDETESMIDRATQKVGFTITTIPFSGGTEGNSHDWSQVERVQTVADKRNLLIDLARTISPDYYLSLDSDVIVPRGGIKALIETLQFEGYDAACPRVWVWNAFYVAGKYQQGRLAFLGRRDYGVQAVDVVTSSACLMSPKVFKEKAIRYGVALRGKDFGWAPGHEVNGWNASECVAWSKAAKSKGMKLAANCNLTFEHRMKNEA